MTTADLLPDELNQKFAPGDWSQTVIMSGVAVLSASTWHAYIVRDAGDVQATDTLIAPTVSVSITDNSVTFSLTAAQVATLIGAGSPKFAGYWSVYSDTLARTLIGGRFIIDRTATNSGTSSSPLTLTVTSTTATLSVVAPAVVPTVLDTWNAARDASATTVADIVCLTDSIGVLGSVSAKPWGWLLAKSLSAFDTRAEGAGWVFAKGNGDVVIAMDSCAGTASTTGAGGYASDLTAGQVAYHTMTCDGVSIVYTKQSGGGSIQVRDGGAGGTLVQTISTANATTQRSRVTTVDLTTFASRQVHLTVTGGPVHLEGIYGHAGDQTTGTRVWCPGHSGYTTGDFVTNTTLAMDLIGQLDPALVIIATGYNDTNATTYEADLRSLVALVQAQTGNNVAIMSPWGGSDGVTSDQAFALAAQTVAADNDLAYFELYEMLGAVGANIDPWDLSADGAHPRVGASQMMADLVLAKVAIDPTLVALSTPERGPRDYIGSLVYRRGTSGQFNVEASLGYPVMSLYGAEGDTEAQLSAFNATLATALGVSGAGFSLGAGGSTAADTLVTRNGAGVVQVTSALGVSGLTGATQASRYVGATASGAPASGTFAIGDFIIDRTGKVYICTTAGSPGTWTSSGTGDVVGPSSSTDGRVVTFSGATGKLIQDGGTLLTSLLTSTTAASTYQPLDADLTTVASPGTSGTVPVSGGTNLAWAHPHHARSAYLLPSGAIAETMDRMAPAFTNSGLLSTGRLHLVAIALPKGKVITSITFVSGNTALSVGTNQWFGLFDSSRVCLNLTGDDTSNAWGSFTAKTLNLSSTFTTTYAGLHYIGIMVKATTVPTLYCATVGTTIAGIAPIVNGVADTGLSTPPGLPFTAAALTVSGSVPYAYVS